MSAESSSDQLKAEIGHVLFVDIVGYSKLLINEQTELLGYLKDMVRGSEQVRAAEAEGKLITLATGDGMALVFRNNPEAPAHCALELSRADLEHPELKLRMGLHSGPINEVLDVNERANVTGAGINLAQRVMDCGDAGHILLSRRVAEDLAQYRHWVGQLHDLGECEVKHGVRLHLFNLYTDELGNAALPAKLHAPVTTSETKAASKALLPVVIAAVLVAAGLIFFLLYKNAAGPSLVAPAKSIAVLPFENLSNDKENAYFADGIQDEILTRLSKIADLKTISRTSTQHYKSVPENLPEIARQLGVAHILEGSVQKSGEKVRINVQLIKAANDSHLWAETFDRKLIDIFSVESEVATNIAEKLSARLTGAEVEAIKARPTEDSSAHELYLKGLYFWNKRNAADFRKALASFEQATEKDPGYALAWAGVADVYILLPLYGGDDPSDAYPKAKAAADKAVALDPKLAQPHACLGNYYCTTLQFAASIREFEEAIALNPNYATAHHWFGDSVLECIGENERAIAEHQRALELDPLSIAINTDLGYSYYLAGRYPEAIAQVNKALELDPNSYYAHYNLGWILEVSGNLPGAIAEYRKSTILDDDPFSLALLGHGLALAGDRAAAEKILQQLASSARYVPDYSLGLIHLGLGDKKEALNYFEKSFAQGQADLNTIRFDPLLKSLKGEPRFEALKEKILPAAELAKLTSR